MQIKQYLKQRLRMEHIPDDSVEALARSIFVDADEILVRGRVSVDDLCRWGNFVYAVLDVETTGHRPGPDAITEIGVVVARGEQVLSTYSTLVGPVRPIPYVVQQITGITSEMLEGAPKWADVSNQVSSMIASLPIFAHNAPFDRGFVRYQLLDAASQAPEHWFCTVKGARKAIPGFRSYSLDNLTRELGLVRERAHRALDDAVATQTLVTRIAEACIASDHRLDLAFPGLSRAIIGLEARLG